MIEVINKEHKEIKLYDKSQRFAPFITLRDGKYVHFPVSTVELVQMRVGMYVHFIVLNGDLTGFMVNECNSGFILTLNSKRDIAMRIGSKALVDWLKKKLKCEREKSPSYYIRKTDTMHEGCTVYEVLAHRPKTAKKKVTLQKANL